MRGRCASRCSPQRFEASRYTLTGKDLRTQGGRHRVCTARCAREALLITVNYRSTVRTDAQLYNVRPLWIKYTLYKILRVSRPQDRNRGAAPSRARPVASTSVSPGKLDGSTVWSHLWSTPCRSISQGQRWTRQTKVACSETGIPSCCRFLPCPSVVV